MFVSIMLGTLEAILTNDFEYSECVGEQYLCVSR